MTGKPCFELNLKDDDQEEVWSKLLEIPERKYAAVCSCYKSKNQNEEEFDNLGLIQPHGYSVLIVKEIGGNRLLKLKNP